MWLHGVLQPPTLQGQGRSHRFREVAFDLLTKMRREVATPAVVHFVVQYGLRHYASNSVATNDAVCAVLTRIVAPAVSSAVRGTMFDGNSL